MRKTLGLIINLLVLAMLTGPLPGEPTLADLLEQPGINFSDPETRARIVEATRRQAEERRRAARQKATALGLALRTQRPDGRIQEICDFDGEKPLYFTTHNSRAAISTGADLVRSSFAVDGTGVTIGMWDGGSGRSTHQEFGSRMVVKDGAPSINHATHVGGTLAASGTVSSARGMSPGAVVDSYDWNSDTSEMAARGATAPGQPNQLYLSNHSYGFVVGWNYTGNPSRLWEWWGNGTDPSAFEQDFGRYNSNVRDQDSIAFNAPYYLIFRSAGNERTDNPSPSDPVAFSPSSPLVSSYDAATDPPGDGLYRGGFETIGFNALAKNVITVGAVNDAVTGSSRDPAKGTMASFSSWGPTDDGRIKPDVVANGVGLYSPLNGSNSSYGSYSGTSMSTPNATGSAALLIQHYGNLFSGGAMRSASLKGLLIHTADDLGNAGPDYKFGWGLVDAKAAADLLSDHQAFPDKQRLTEDTITTASTIRSFPFVWDGTSPIRATLCWTDPAGPSTTTSDLRSPRLVNNLQLEVIGPNAESFRPFVMPFVGDWSQASMNSTATTGVNDTDNVEQVLVSSPPAAGIYQAVVTYSGTLTNSTQDFSLILSGTADVPPPPPPLSLTGISPSSGLAGPVTLEVSGTGLLSTTAVKLSRTGHPDIPAGSVTLNSGQLSCDFDLTTAAAGDWDLVATNPNNDTSTLPAAFSVIGSLWNEAFDGAPPASWSSDASTGSNSWVLTSAASHSPSTSYFAPGPSSKSTTNLVTPSIDIPAEATDLQLKFWHDYQFQNERDGGRLEFSVDGGAWFDVESSGSGASFASNGYNATLKGTGNPSGRNEFVGLRAWTGSSGGFIQTIVNFTDTNAFAGKGLRIRWRLGTDSSNNSGGWHVDTVSLVGGGNIGNQPPIISIAAGSTSTEFVTDPDTTVYEVVRGASVDLNVTADDDGGESALAYTWSVATGPGSPVFFSPNATNSAKLTNATFETLGEYQLSVAVSDAEGLTVNSSVNIRVLAEASSMAVTPPVASLVVGGNQAFSATLLDQFANPMPSQPAPITWGTSGGGTIDSFGFFAAQNAGGPFVVSGSGDGFTGTASVTINPAPATITLDGLAQTYDGTPRTATYITNPPSLAVGLAYNGSGTPPTDVGSYFVEAMITDPNYQGSQNGTLVVSPATATITLDNLVQTYDGSPKPVTVTTNPSGLATIVTYDGSTTAPTEAASYAVVATISDPNYQGSETGTLVIEHPDFGDWQLAHFTESERLAGLDGPDQDPDLDRIVNLIEYATGSDPKTPNAALWSAAIEPDVASTPRLTLSFSRPVGLPDVVYEVQVADSLDAATWQAVGAFTVEPGASPDSETVTGWDGVAADTASKRFIRLKVALSGP